MSWLTVGLAVAGLVSALVLMGRVPTLGPWSGRRPHGAVFVVIPARNEADRLPRLLTSLREQTVAPTRTVVVDDDSDDATAVLAAAGGAHVVRSTGPPPGWAGKTWACHTGMIELDAAGDDTIVFIDADVWLAPDALARLVETHRQLTPSGLMSVQPFHETRQAYEQLSAVPNLVSMMARGWGLVAPAPPTRVAFGPCLVTRADDLRAVGGFEAVASETIEDIALARCYRAHDRGVRCLAGRATVRFRMYEHGVRGLLDGWTKNLSGGARHTAVLSTLGAVTWIAGALAVGVDAIARPAIVVVGLWAAYAVQTWWMLRRIGRFSPLTAFAFPVAAASFVGLFVSSVVVRGLRRRVSWRGRRIPVGG